MCLLGAAACFSIAFFIHLPFFAIRPSKFAVSIRSVSVPAFRGVSTYLLTQSWKLAGHARVCSILSCPYQKFLYCPRFVILIGPMNQFKHCTLTRLFFSFLFSQSHVLLVFSKERLPFSMAYLSSLGLTLYFSLGVGTSRSNMLLCLIDPLTNRMPLTLEP